MNQKRRIIGIVSLAVCWAGFGLSAGAQPVYSQNIVGYYSLDLFPGDNYVANQLGNSDNTLNVLFNADVPEGATFTEWNSTSLQYSPVSSYDTNSGWSIDYTMSYGQGGLFHSPSAFTNMFVGDVWPGLDPNEAFTPPLVAGSGALMLSPYIPIDSATFYEVVGRDPQDGESVTVLDAASQVSTTTTFENGAWNNGVPLLNIGESAFFNLQTYSAEQAAPEPASFSLLGAGAILLLAVRICGRKPLAGKQFAPVKSSENSTTDEHGWTRKRLNGKG